MFLHLIKTWISDFAVSKLLMIIFASFMDLRLCVSYFVVLLGSLTDMLYYEIL